MSSEPVNLTKEDFEKLRTAIDWGIKQKMENEIAPMVRTHTAEEFFKQNKEWVRSTTNDIQKRHYEMVNQIKDELDVIIKREIVNSLSRLIKSEMTREFRKQTKEYFKTAKIGLQITQINED